MSPTKSSKVNQSRLLSRAIEGLVDLDPLQQYAATTNSIVKRQACSLGITRPGAILTVKFLPPTQELDEPGCALSDFLQQARCDVVN